MFVGVRDLAHARGRFALMTVLVVLVTVLVGLLSGLTAGLARESTSAVTGLHTSRLVFSGDDPSFETSRVPTDGSVPGEPLGFAQTRATAGRHSTPVTAAGVRPGSDVAPDARGVRTSVVVLSEQASEDLDATSGDQVRIAGTDVEVGAVRGDASFSHTPVVWMTLADWQRATHAGDHATVIATDRASAPKGFTTVPLEDARSAVGSFTSENGSLQLIRGFLFVISALVIGSFFTVWTVQRSREIAVLKALGGSTAYLLGDALAQAALLLVTGTALGGLVVVGVGFVASGLVPFALSPLGLGGPLAALVVLGLLGAGLAVRRVTAIDPLTALGSAR